MILPTVSPLSGSPTLDSDYALALFAVQDAIKAFSRIEFNQRDYLTQSDWDKAVEQRADIRAKLASAEAYLDTHLEHLSPL